MTMSPRARCGASSSIVLSTGSARRHHDPHHAARLQLTDDIAQVLRRLDSLGDLRRDRVGASVVHDYLVPTLEQPLHHVAAHSPQPDHRQLHCCRSVEVS